MVSCNSFARGWFISFLGSLGPLPSSWADNDLGLAGELGISLLRKHNNYKNTVAFDDCCLAALSKTSETCRSEHQPFCITQYVKGTPRMQTYFTMPVEVALDNEAGNEINHNYPGLRTLNARHHVYVVKNFLSPEERMMMLSEAKTHKWIQALDTEAFDSQKACSYKNDASCDEMMSHASLCRMAVHKKSHKTEFTGEGITRMVQSKIRELLPENRHTELYRFESLQITRYKKGDFYTPHLDGRRVTVLMYIDADNSAGGSTTFPRLDLTVLPVPGRAVVFFPTFADGTDKVSMIHASEELMAGQKVIAQQWIDTASAHHH